MCFQVILPTLDSAIAHSRERIHQEARLQQTRIHAPFSKPVVSGCETRRKAARGTTVLPIGQVSSMWKGDGNKSHNRDNYSSERELISRVHLVPTHPD